MLLSDSICALHQGSVAPLASRVPVQEATLDIMSAPVVVLNAELFCISDSCTKPEPISGTSCSMWPTKALWVCDLRLQASSVWTISVFESSYQWGSSVISDHVHFLSIALVIA